MCSRVVGPIRLLSTAASAALVDLADAPLARTSKKTTSLLRARFLSETYVDAPREFAHDAAGPTYGVAMPDTLPICEAYDTAAEQVRTMAELYSAPSRTVDDPAQFVREIIKPPAQPINPAVSTQVNINCTRSSRPLEDVRPIVTSMAATCAAKSLTSCRLRPAQRPLPRQTQTKLSK